MIYILLFVGIVATIIINVYTNRKLEKIFFWFDCSILAVAAALRYYVGLDYAGYISIFRVASNNDTHINLDTITFLSGKIGVEKCFIFICMLFSKMGIRGEFFIGIMSIFTIMDVGYVISKMSSEPLVSILIFYVICFLQMINLARQYMAVAVVFMAVYMLCKGKNLRYFLLIIVASLIHSSALIGLVFIILKKWRFSYGTYFLYIGVAVVSYIMKDYVIRIIQKFGIYNDLLITNKSLKIFTVFPAVVIVLLLGIYLNNMKEDEKSRIMMHSVMIVLLISVISLNIFYFARISYYFMIYIILFMPELLKVMKTYKERFIVVIGYFMMMGAIFINNATDEKNSYLPYDTVIEAVKNGYIR